MHVDVEPTVDSALALVYTIHYIRLAPLIFLYAGIIYVVVFVNKYCKRLETRKYKTISYVRTVTVMIKKNQSVSDSEEQYKPIVWLLIYLVSPPGETTPYPDGYRAFSLPGQFAPRSESANRTLANSLPGTFAPWSFRSLAHSLPDLLVPWNFRSLNVYLTVCVYRPKRFKLVSKCK